MTVAGPASGHAASEAAYVIRAAGNDAQADDVEQQPRAGVADCRWQAAAVDGGDAVGQDLGDGGLLIAHVAPVTHNSAARTIEHLTAFAKGDRCLGLRLARHRAGPSLPERHEPDLACSLRTPARARREARRDAGARHARAPFLVARCASQLLRSRTPLKPGMRLTAIMTAAVRISMVRPRHGDGAQIAALLEVEDQHRQHLGLGGEEDHGGGQLADHSDENEAPGGDQAGPEQRRRDVAQGAQARSAEDAARPPPARVTATRKADCSCW